MKPYYEESNIKIFCGDCLDILKDIDTNSIDAVITDPPYHLISPDSGFHRGKDSPFKRTAKGTGFMGKKWDGGDIAFRTEVWKEALRVLKPGGYLLSFGGSRTYHRMACAIEDAGFEIRDMVEWIYGSGFPKSLNIGKAIDKQDTIDFRKSAGLVIKKARENKNLTMDELCNILGLNNEGHGGMVNHYENGRATPTLKLWKKICEVLDINDLQDYEEIKKGRTKVIGEIENPISWFGKGIKEIATTEQAKEWQGWGTALKPSHEPICMARKPLSEKTVAENVLKYGTGGINIDECRVEHNELLQGGFGKAPTGYSQGVGSGADCSGSGSSKTTQGRFPANLIHNGSDEVMEVFPDTSKGWGKATNSKNPGGTSMFKQGGVNANRYDMGGQSAARFFYCAKASKAERNMGCEGLEERQIRRLSGGKFANNSGSLNSDKSGANSKNSHPTVKPIKLMKYLIKLVTTKDAVVLDPFVGSGTTLRACKNLRRKCIGIEISKEYCDIAVKRLSGQEVLPL